MTEEMIAMVRNLLVPGFSFLLLFLLLPILGDEIAADIKGERYYVSRRDQQGGRCLIKGSVSMDEAPSDGEIGDRLIHILNIFTVKDFRGGRVGQSYLEAGEGLSSYWLRYGNVPPGYEGLWYATRFQRQPVVVGMVPRGTVVKVAAAVAPEREIL